MLSGVPIWQKLARWKRVINFSFTNIICEILLNTTQYYAILLKVVCQCWLKKTAKKIQFIPNGINWNLIENRFSYLTNSNFFSHFIMFMYLLAFGSNIDIKKIHVISNMLRPLSLLSRTFLLLVFVTIVSLTSQVQSNIWILWWNIFKILI